MTMMEEMPHTEIGPGEGPCWGCDGPTVGRFEQPAWDSDPAGKPLLVFNELSVIFWDAEGSCSKSSVSK